MCSETSLSNAMEIICGIGLRHCLNKLHSNAFLSLLWYVKSIKLLFIFFNSKD